MGATTSYIPKSRARALAKRSDVWGLWLTLHVWGVVAASMALFIIAPHPITFIISFILIGSRQHGMAILMHDAAHGILFKTKALNEFAGKYLLGAPYGGNLDSYRKYHLQHHRFAQSENDPDISLSKKYPVSRASLARKLLRDLSGLTFLRIRIATLKMKAGDQQQIDGAGAFQRNSPWPFLITNSVIFALLWSVGHWPLYFTLWLAPLMTWFFVVIRLRNITEHAMTSFDDNPLTHARTTHTTLFEKIVFGPYWVNYHVEHHAFMYVPCYRLKALHKAMKEHHKNMEIRTGYLAVIKMATKA